MSVACEEIRLNLPHIELAAQAYGPEDGQPVIALHGWLDNAATFARLAPRLVGLRIVALDLPGHGHSGHRPVGASYTIWDYVHDVLQAAEQFGWQRFSLLGHSLGGIVSVLLAGAMPERVERLALIDGVLPQTSEADAAPQRLGDSLRAQLRLGGRRKPLYGSFEEAVRARMKDDGAVSREAAELLVRRGLMPVPGGYTWRTDGRLMLPSPMRLSRAHALAFVNHVVCPTSLILARQGLMARPEVLGLIEGFPFELHRLDGGHHLHLDSEAGAIAVAECFNGFFQA